MYICRIVCRTSDVNEPQIWRQLVPLQGVAPTPVNQIAAQLSRVAVCLYPKPRRSTGFIPARSILDYQHC